MVTNACMSMPSTIAPDVPETTAYATTEQEVDVSTSEAPSGQTKSDNDNKHKVNTDPGFQIESDFLLLIPERAGEEGPQSGNPGNRARALVAAEDYDLPEKDTAADDDDLEVAEAIVFKPLFRYRKRNDMRRRVYSNGGPERKVPFKYCPPCRYHF